MFKDLSTEQVDVLLESLNAYIEGLREEIEQDPMPSQIGKYVTAQSLRATLLDKVLHETAQPPQHSA